MFKRSNSDSCDDVQDIHFTWDGHNLIGREGDSVASALLGAGIKASRTHSVTDEQRAPYCMMGTCFECLVEINGVANLQGCQVKLTEGLRVCIQRGARR